MNLSKGYPIILLNPSMDEVKKEISTMLISSNGKRKKRILTKEECFNCIDFQNECVVQIDGGSVANAYGYTTQSTRFGFANVKINDYTVIIIQIDSKSISGPISAIWGAKYSDPRKLFAAIQANYPRLVASKFEIAGIQLPK
jgi:hypothetical protein